MGLKALIDGLGFDLAISLSDNTPMVKAPAAPILIGPAKPARQHMAKKTRAAVPAKQKRKPVSAAKKSIAAAAPAWVGADARGSIRNAVRAELTTSGKDLTSMTQDVQKIWPEKNRDYIGTVLCQLAKSGECELGQDGKWRKT